MYKNASKCAVAGCSAKDQVVHRFPNPKTDLPRLQNWINLVGLEVDNPIQVYNKKFICAVHFAPDCSSPGTKRLNKNSYPTLNLPIVNLQKIEPSGDVPSVKCDNTVLDVSGCDILDFDGSNEVNKEITANLINTRLVRAPKKARNNGLLKQIGVTSCRQLTPRCARFYNITTRLLRKNRQQNTQRQLFKSRLSAAEKFTDEYLCGKYHNCDNFCTIK